VDGLAYLLHWPTNYGWQAWAQSLLTVVVPSHRTIWASVALDHLAGGVKPLRRAI
jgi:hypothetical protein